MSAEPGTPDADSRPCPHCGQTIKSAALVCRHCQRDLFAPADAPPLVGLHDWEREKPPEKVVYTVRLPVSERQWALTCYILAAVLTLFWVGLAVRPAPGKVVTVQPVRQEPPSQIAALLESPSPTPAASKGLLFDEGNMPRARSENASLTEPVPSAAPPTSEAAETPGDWGTDSDSTSPDTSSSASASSRSDAISIGAGALVDATELIRAYNNHLDTAEDTFTHKPITVAGHVVAVGKASDKTPYAMLRGTSDTRVQCLFTSLRGKSAPPVEVGQDVHISGTCEGRFVDVMISDCQLAR